MTQPRNYKRWNLMAAAAVAAGLLSIGAPTRADTVILKDGTQLVGEIERTDGGYWVKTATGRQRVEHSEISTIVRTPAGSTPATTPAAAAPPPPPPATSGAPAKPATPGGKAEVAKRTADALVEQGTDAMSAGDYKAARDIFVDVIQVDARNRRSLEALGFCYLKLNDVARATRSMEGALVASAEPPSRSLTLNLASALVRNGNPMRGAKVIKDFLAAPARSAAEPDETALNALAVCLGQASEEARVNQLFQDCVKFYDQYVAKLEATRKGEKRWGIQWVPAAEWKKKDDANKVVYKELDGKNKVLTDARKSLGEAQGKLNSAKAARFSRAPQNVPAAEAQVRQETARVEQARAAYYEVAAKLVRPGLPSAFDPVPMEDLPAPTVVAVATPPRPEPSTPTKPPAVAPPVKPPATATPPATVTPPVAVNPPATTTPPAVAPPAVPAPPPVAAKPAGPRKVYTYAAGFAVAPDLIVTTAAVVHGANAIRVQTGTSDVIDGEVVRADEESGLALVRLKGKKVRYIGLADAFGGGAVQCVSFPTVSLFDPAAEAVGGSAGAVKDATKDDWAVKLNKHPRLGGGPLVANGQVVGVATGGRDADPASFPAASLAKLKQFVGADARKLDVPGDGLQSTVMVTGVRDK